MRSGSSAVVTVAVAAGVAAVAAVASARRGAKAANRAKQPQLLPDDAAYVARLATPNDAAVVHQMVLLLAEFERAVHEVRIGVKTLRADLARGACEALLLSRRGGDDVVGVAVFFRSYSTWEGECMYLEDLFVRQEHRGQGAGSALLRAVATLARHRDAARLQWQALSWNRSAIDFYESPRVGARLRKGDDGSEWLNFIMERPQIRDLSMMS